MSVNKILKLAGKQSASLSLTAFLICFVSAPQKVSAQKDIAFGIHADPQISWFSSNTREIRYDGARPGFNFGLNFYRFFAPNYAFSAGLSLINSGGRLVSSDTMKFEFEKPVHTIAVVKPGNPVTYKVKYLAFNAGLKLQTKQKLYTRFFTDIGLDPKILLSSKANIPSLQIDYERPLNALSKVNLGYHVTAGVEYSLGESTALVAGLTFENNFTDLTQDDRNLPDDIISHRMLSFRFGLNF